MVIDQNIWQGKRVLVTGHSGFKGSWLCIWLKKLGAKVIGYSIDPPSNPNLYHLTNISTLIDKDIYSNINNLDALTSVLQDFQPECIFHLAAQSLVKQSYETPFNTFETNTIGTLNLFEAIRLTGNPCAVINVTSDKCYLNNNEGISFTESDALGGYDPYSSSKACSEIVSMAYQKIFLQDGNVLLATARAGNVIGGGDWGKYRLIPDIVNAIAENKVLQLRNPSYTRPWQHVLDALHGYIILAQQLIIGNRDYEGAWNFGPNKHQTMSVKHLTDGLLSFFEKTIEYTIETTPEAPEAEALTIDATKAKKILGWKLQLENELAIQWTADWYKIWLSGKQNMQAYSEMQIKQYEDNVTL